MKIISLSLLLSFLLAQVSLASETTYYSAWEASGEFGHTDPLLACDETFNHYKVLDTQYCGYKAPNHDGQYCSFSYKIGCTSAIGYISLSVPQLPKLKVGNNNLSYHSYFLLLIKNV